MATLDLSVNFALEEEVNYFCEPAFECGFFDVVVNDPLPGLNLIVHKRPTHEQRPLFVERLRGELRYWQKREARLFSTEPIFILGAGLEYVGVRKEADFGPFHEYTISL